LSTVHPVLKITAGVLIPAFATVVFNFFNSIVDGAEKMGKLPDPPASTFDIAVGCIFAMIGICVTCSDLTKTLRMVVVCVVLILITMFVDLVLPAFYHANKYYMVAVADLLALTALSWSIWIAG
jgi:hypothetical protein